MQRRWQRLRESAKSVPRIGEVVYTKYMTQQKLASTSRPNEIDIYEPRFT